MWHVSLKGNLHRTHYEASGLVKCTVVFTCIKHATPSTEQDTVDKLCPTSKATNRLLKSFEPNAFTESKGTACIRRSSITEIHRHPAIELISCRAYVCGSSVIDKSRMRVETTDTNSSAGTKDTKSTGWSLFGWFSSTSEPDTLNTTDIAKESTVTAVSVLGKNDAVFNFFFLEISDLLSSSVPDLPLLNINTKGVTLKQNESVTSIFSLNLPPGVPPTFRGYCVRYAYAITINCTYRDLGDGSVRSTTMKIPFRVTNLATALVRLHIPRDPINYNYNVIQIVTHGDIRSDSSSLPSIVAPPLSSDVLVKNGDLEGNRIIAASFSNEAVEELFSRKMEQPVQFGVYSPNVTYTVKTDDPLRSIQREHRKIGYSIDPRISTWHDLDSQLPFAVKVVLLADTFSLRSSIRGVIFCCSPLGQNGQDAINCFRYSITVECVEFIPQDLLKEGSVPPNSLKNSSNVCSDDDNRLCVVHCESIEEHEVYLSMNARQIPFVIPLCEMKYQQTICTSLVEYRWRIRFKFFFTKAVDVIVATGESESTSTSIPAMEKTREVVIPIILTHSVGSGEQTLGLTHVVL